MLNINELHKYMITNQVIGITSGGILQVNDIQSSFNNNRLNNGIIKNRLNNGNNIQSNASGTHNIVQTSEETNYTVQDTLFYPYERDKLFWSFYIMQNGMSNYEMINNKFTHEKKKKFELVDIIRGEGSLLKSLKISKTKVEVDLTNSKCISLNTMCALCNIYRLNMVYVCGKKYYEIILDEDKPYNIIEESNYKFGLKKNVELSTIKKYRDNYWLMESLDKPLKSISSYKVDDLRIICNQLNICTDKMTKPKLYEEILSKL